MRHEFAELLHKEMSVNDTIFLLTADLGYVLWDKIKFDFPKRFHNVGSSEQLMVGMATGLAMDNKIPVCYSITPFLLYRPFEIIKLYLQGENIPVKLVGGGRGRDYKSAGPTHWAEEDENIISVFKNIKSYRPEDVSFLENDFKDFIYNGSPSYINLRK